MLTYLIVGEFDHFEDWDEAEGDETQGGKPGYLNYEDFRLCFLKTNDGVIWTKTSETR